MSLDYHKAARHLSGLVNKRPEVLIVCGSGLAHLSDSITNPIHVPYGDIPGFKVSTVQGHTGELVFGTMDGIEVVCMRGRFHFYEGYSMDQVVFPIRVMRFMGCKLMIATNAAGGLNKDYEVGDIVSIQDHFGGGSSLFSSNPMRGKNDPSLGERFFPISNCYDEKLQEFALDAAKELKIENRLRSNGTYCYTVGPSYESMAECKFLRSVGGDCVGMSTIPEVLTAKHCGMKILVLSLVTNKAVFEKRKETAHASHEEVLAASTQAGFHVQAVVENCVTQARIGAFLKDLPAAPFPQEAPPLLSKGVLANLVCTGMMFGAAMMATGK